MAVEQSENLLTELGLGRRKPPELFRSAAEVGSAAINGYTHVLRRAWKNFDNLRGVLSVRGRPTVYLQNGSTKVGLTCRTSGGFGAMELPQFSCV
jgi:hypothetical protein